MSAQPIGLPGPEEIPEPLFRVVGGNPTDEELAALTAVVVGLTGPAPEAAPDRHRAARAWTRRRQLRLLPAPGPGAWRRSYR